MQHGTLICWLGQRSHIKVKGHLRSSCKIGWKCESGLIWKVEVQLESNLVYWCNMEPLVCSWGQMSYNKVKGHQRSSCKMGSKYRIHLIWKVEVWLEPNLVYWYNVGTFTSSWDQRSQMKVEGNVRSICKIAWKCQIWLICILEDQLKACDPNRCGIKVRCQFASATNCDGRRH